MSRFKQFVSDGGIWGIVVSICFWLIFFFAVRDCARDEKKSSAARMAYRAHRDSVELAERVQQEKLISEISARRAQFYINFIEAHPSFFTPAEFGDWLDRTNYAGMELLYNVYNSSYDNFKDVDEMIEFLGWGSPEYYVTCKRCDYETSFCPDEQYFK